MDENQKRKLKKMAVAEVNPDAAIVDALDDINESLAPLKGVEIITLQGKAGKDGKTPKKGEDYFTKKEIKDIIAEVRDLIEDPEDGKTPVKGEDYFTDDDIEDLVDEVISRIRIPEDGKDADEVNIDDVVKKVIAKLPKPKTVKEKSIVDLVMEIEANEAIGIDWKKIKNVPAHITGRQYPHRAGVSSFLELDDTPNSYSGQALKVVRVNSTGTGLEFAVGSGGGSGTSTIDVNQTLHGFTVGQVIRILDPNDDTYTLAQADGAANAEVYGIVSAVTDVNNFTYTFVGPVTGLAAYPAGTVLFLDPTIPGGLTDVEPTTIGQVSLPLVKVTASGEGLFFNMRGELISAGGGGGGSGTVQTIIGTTDRITVDSTDPENPIIDIALTYAGQDTITILGAVATGTWNADVITGQYGGTGVANTGKTITIGGNFATSGAFTTTLTVTGNTNVTLPTTGTLATLAGAESLTNKKLGSLTTNGFVKTSGGDGTLSVDTNTYLTTAAAAAAYQPLDSTLTALAAYNTNGILTQTGADTFVGRTITGTANRLTVTNGDGVAGNPTLTIPNSAQLDVAKLTNLTTNGFVKTSGGDGTLSIDTSTYLTAMTVAGSGTELQYRSSATALAALTGSSVSGANLTLGGGLTITPTASTGSPTRALTVTAPAHTALTASTDFNNIVFDLSATQQFATGAKTLQRAMVIKAPTYSAVGSTTITEADTVVIEGPPIAGTNVTITNPMALKVGTPGAFNNTLAAFGGSLNGYYEVIMHNTSSGTLASSDFVAQADNSTNSTNFVDMGITSSTFADTNYTLWGGADAAYLFSESTSLSIATMRAGANLRFGTGGTLTANLRAVMSDSSFALTPGVATTGSPNALSLVGAAHTTLTASTEASDVLFNLARTVQFSTGALTSQSAVKITAPTYGFVGASTITTAATVSISGAPVAGTNATITNAYALDVVAGVTHVGGSLSINGGSAGSPALYFDLNNTAGFFSSTTGTIGMTSSGTSRYTWNATDYRSTGSGFILARNIGTNGLMLATTGSTTTGIGIPGSNILNLISNNTIGLQVDAAQKVFVKAGAASGTTAAVGGTIFDYFADVGNTTTTETDLFSSTLLASTLNANGTGVSATYGGIFVNSATATRQLKVYFGGTVIFDSGALTVSAATDWNISVLCIRVSSSVVRCTVAVNLTGASTGNFAKYTEVTGLTLTNTQILKITGQAGGVGAATNDIVAKLGKVRFEQAA